MGLLYDYHELLTLGFVKVTRDNVKKGRTPLVRSPALCVTVYIDKDYLPQPEDAFSFIKALISLFVIKP